MSARIKIILRPNGTASVEVDGVADESCHAISEGFTRALGTTTLVTEKPAEYVELDTIKQYNT